MLDRVVPPCVVVCEVGTDVEEPLFPAEERHIARAVAKRRAEFTTVRYCARQALRGLGRQRPVMVPGDRGEPTWPDGVVGSLTHCEGYRAAGVARSQEVSSLGIDAEPNSPLPSGVLDVVASAAERDHLGAVSAQRPEVAFDRLLFSIKESVYKAWFPLERCWLGFDDAEVRIDLGGGFQARLQAAAAPWHSVRGAWACSGSHVASVVVMPATF
ncbi:4'-phosphopantetheinyl transferase superfamily protein [Actinomyces sp. 2119]|uniref:4'-phosphopantetheinyl transferase superfamily protein n=1 Tax=Actinomyces lilanjuaniae TaxID=2321394 RepID=A0ABN5PQR7_9ACTO|nr:4'-phosphopantetheinyl transferase superfamily protein [Actinomyces lilanjuaniae]RJF42025.1 4'-phosphopantetheinyl transferase superfamily protein [Actinomyces sp. 2119]